MELTINEHKKTTPLLSSLNSRSLPHWPISRHHFLAHSIPFLSKLPVLWSSPHSTYSIPTLSLPKGIQGACKRGAAASIWAVAYSSWGTATRTPRAGTGHPGSPPLCSLWHTQPLTPAGSWGESVWAGVSRYKKPWERQGWPPLVNVTGPRWLWANLQGQGCLVGFLSLFLFSAELKVSKQRHRSLQHFASPPRPPTVLGLMRTQVVTVETVRPREPDLGLLNP